MKVHFMRYYVDRYGVEHKAGSEAEMSDSIAGKLVRWAFARLVTEPDPPPESAITTAAFAPPENAAPLTVRRAPGRPRKG